jgi:hypothetical protein
MGSQASIYLWDTKRRGLWHAKRRGSWLVGCGVVLAICVLILVGLGIFVALNARGWAATGMQQGLAAIIEEAPVDDAEKAESLAVVENFVQRFRDKDVSFQQLGSIFAALEGSPLVPAAMAMGTGQSYFKDSGLTEEQKADGMRQLGRITFGLVDKQVKEADLVEVLTPLKAKATENEAIALNFNSQNIRIKPPKNTTDEEVLAFIEAARAKADEKELPAEPPAFDLSNELQRLIDAGLTGTAATEDPGEHAGGHADDADEAPASDEPASQGP